MIATQDIGGDSGIRRIKAGQTVRITVGTLTGLTGTVVSRGNTGTLTVKLDRGLFANVEMYMVESVRSRKS